MSDCEILNVPTKCKKLNNLLVLFYPIQKTVSRNIVIVISEFAELNKVQRPNLWPDDYSFMRMSRLVAAGRLPNYQINGGVVWYLTNVDAFRHCWDLISTL